MKSTRRHELQHNVLDAEIGKGLQFFKNHGTKLLWALAIVATVAMAIYWYTSSQSRRKAETAAQYSDLKTRQLQSGEMSDSIVEGFKSLIEQKRIPRIAAMACVDVGDIYATKMMNAENRTDADSLAVKATEYYQKAIADFPKHQSPLAKAHLGLAKLAEGQGNVTSATKEYKAVVAMSGLAGQPVVAEAEAGLKKLDSLKEKVKLATTLPAVPKPATQPATKPVDLVANANPPIADLPVPQGFKLDKKRSRDFAKGKRYIDHVYTGKAGKIAIERFYKQQMPICRWELVSKTIVREKVKLVFKQKEERCAIVINDGTIMATIWPEKKSIKAETKPTGAPITKKANP